MRRVVEKCERCNREMECRFYGRPADPNADRAQNGEWMCRECVKPRLRELDGAIERLKRALGTEKGEDT